MLFLWCAGQEAAAGGEGEDSDGWRRQQDRRRWQEQVWRRWQGQGGREEGRQNSIRHLLVRQGVSYMPPSMSFQGDAFLLPRGVSH